MQRSKWTIRWMVGTAGMLFAAGCADSEMVAPHAPAGALASAEAHSGESVARALAAAMAKPQVRAHVLQAMRRSPWTEHKLVLQEFVGTPAGAEMVRAGAAGTGMSEAALAAAIRSLPDLDFYVPVRGQRLGWRGTPDVSVAVELGDRSEIRGYTPAGRQVRYNARGAAPAAHEPVLFLLHPAETKGRRIGAQPAGRPGSVIQDADDGELSLQIVEYLENGDSMVVDVVDPALLEGSGPRISLAPLGQVTAENATATYLNQIQTVDMCDNGNCWETNELEFRAQYRNSSNGVISSRTLRRTGINSTGAYNLGLLNISAVVTYWSTNYLWINVVETDGWPNPDDQYGVAEIRNPDQYGSISPYDPTVYFLGGFRDPYRCSALGYGLNCSELMATWFAL